MNDTIVLGVDFKDETKKLCKEAVNYAKKLSATITLVHVVEYDTYYPSFPYDEQKVKDFQDLDINWKLNELKSYIESIDGNISEFVVEKGTTYEVLSRVADRINAKAILVGVGQHFLFEDLIGSTTEKVSRLAKQKVVIVPRIFCGLI